MAWRLTPRRQRQTGGPVCSEPAYVCLLKCRQPFPPALSLQGDLTHAMTQKACRPASMHCCSTIQPVRTGFPLHLPAEGRTVRPLRVCTSARSNNRSLAPAERHAACCLSQSLAWLTDQFRAQLTQGWQLPCGHHMHTWRSVAACRETFIARALSATLAPLSLSSCTPCTCFSTLLQAL